MKAYKFRPASQIAFAFDIIINKRLHCADWKNLNDPMEGSFVYSYKEKEETDVSKRVKGISEAKRKYKICSLSGTFDSHLLWSHYAGGFDGVAIEVDLPDDSPSIKLVDYRGVFAFLDMADNISENEAAKKILFSKYHEWQYEEEVRALNDSEWFELRLPIKRVIAGHRMPKALFNVLNITCNSLGIILNKVGIGDEGIDANYVAPPEHL
jgi:hypothetical protein